MFSVRITASYGGIPVGLSFRKYHQLTARDSILAYEADAIV